MTYPKTILEVHELEEEFKVNGLSPNDYLFITMQLKIDIHDNHDNPSPDFKEKMQASMREVRRILKTIDEPKPK